MSKKEYLEKIRLKTKEHKEPIMLFVLLLILDFAVFAFSFSLYHVFRPDILIIVLYLSFYLYLFLTKRKGDIVFLLISTLLAFVWLLVANNQYGYNQQMISIYGINSYPLFAWAGGLAALYIVFNDIKRLMFHDNHGYKIFILFSLLYVFFIISSETIAYHVFNIRNNATAMYSGLPLCDCIHAPHWMQISYLLIGPLYYILCRLYLNYRLKEFGGLAKNKL